MFQKPFADVNAGRQSRGRGFGPTIFLLCGLVLWAGGGPLTAQEPEYVVRYLGAIGGGPSTAVDLNEAGQVVGYSDTGEFSPEGFSVERAFVWLPSSAYGLPAGLHDLGSLRSHPQGSSRGLAISDKGQIVGSSEIDLMVFPGEPFRAAFSWRNGVMGEVPFPGERPPYNSASEVNADGMIALTVGTGFSCWSYIWLPEPAYGMEAGAHWLPTLPGMGEGWVKGINTHGQVVGKNLPACDIVGLANAVFLWLPEPAYGLPAGIHSLTSDLPQTWYVDAYGINDQGMVIGTFSDPSETSGFVWQAGVRTVLPLRPTGLNDRGWIVGRSENRAVLWRDGQMSFLDDLIPADAGWTLRTANSINDRGQIVGYGLDGGQGRAYLLDLALIFADGFESGSTEAWSSVP